MFGFPSLNKLLVLALIILVVWQGFKFLGQLDRARKEALRQQAKAKTARPPAAGTANQVEDMVKCRVCGAYMPARGAVSCGKPNCPY
jgi:uncharacterized protein